jgi:hypothetical protein
MIYFSENVGLVWLHQSLEVLGDFLEYKEPKTSQRNPFCDAPLDFWNHRGRQKDKPLYSGLRVVFFVGVSKPDKRLFATAKIKGDCPFEMAEVFGSSFRGIRLPRQTKGRGGKEYFFPDGIWLSDVEYIEPLKEWPPHDKVGAPEGSCVLDGDRWRLLKNWICGNHRQQNVR